MRLLAVAVVLLIALIKLTEITDFKIPEWIKKLL